MAAQLQRGKRCTNEHSRAFQLGRHATAPPGHQLQTARTSATDTLRRPDKNSSLTCRRPSFTLRGYDEMFFEFLRQNKPEPSPQLLSSFAQKNHVDRGVSWTQAFNWREQTLVDHMASTQVRRLLILIQSFLRSTCTLVATADRLSRPCSLLAVSPILRVFPGSVGRYHAERPRWCHDHNTIAGGNMDFDSKRSPVPPANSSPEFHYHLGMASAQKPPDGHPSAVGFSFPPPT